jgi:glycosyltransferase involved in cell wall biosynthesis
VSEQNIEISVIMGVYNQWNKGILLDAVQSILDQTMREFEFIIWDDGSDPEAAGHIQELADMDERIVLAGKEENRGLAYSLNACIRLAKGKYIARMDADDISLPNRLERQYQFLESHPEYAWCGCNTQLFDADGVWGIRRMPERPEKSDYLKYSPYVHPTVMFRSLVFDSNEGYLESEDTLRCEDYEIFMRLRSAGLWGYNLQETLFCYREDKAAYKRRKMKYRIREAKLRYCNFKEMGILFPFGWLYVIRPIAGGFIPTPLMTFLKRTRCEQAQRRSYGQTQQEVSNLPEYTEKSTTGAASMGLHESAEMRA